MGDGMQFSYKKGQGATEYLVLLAVVLIVAMVAIALLGFFPGLAGDAKIAQSDSYWRGTARPFAILEHSQTAGEANMTMVIQNVDADQRQITAISVVGSGITGNASTYLTTVQNQYWSSGEKKIATLDFSGNCTSGNTYEYSVNFTYNTGSISGMKQYGEKTLVGKCN